MEWMREIRGRDLRYLLTVLLLEAGRPLTVAELVAQCEREGVVFVGRGSKIVSDGLRAELAWRRVDRVARGVYRYAGAPRSTKHWIRRRVTELRAYLAEVEAGAEVPYPRPSSWRSSGSSPVADRS